MYEGRSAAVAHRPMDRGPRRSLMLAAQLSVGEVSQPVRIRNMSDQGAMVDGPILAEAGLRVMLERQEIAVPGTVIWAHGGQCGISLERHVAIDDWIAGHTGTVSLTNRQQARVDATQMRVREGGSLPDSVDRRLSRPQPINLQKTLAHELERVAASLGATGLALACDPAVLSSHADALQVLDLATAILERLGTVLASDHPASAVEAIDMHDLRSRLNGRPTLT